MMATNNGARIIVLALALAGVSHCTAAKADVCSLLGMSRTDCRSGADLTELAVRLNQMDADERAEREAAERAERARDREIATRCKPIRTVGADGLARITYANPVCNGGVIAGGK